MKFLRRLLWGIAGGVVLLGLLFVWWTVPFRPAPHAADLVPTDTLVFVQVPNFKSARKHFTDSPTCALWKEPQVQAFLYEPLAALREVVGDQSARKFNQSLAEITRAPQAEAFLAVTQLTFPLSQPGLVIGADVKGNLFKVKLAVLNLEFNLRRYNPTRRLQHSRVYQGVSYTVWRVRSDVSLCYTFFGSMVVVTVGEAPMQAVIAHYKSPGTGTLADGDGYQQFLKALPAERDALIYINPSPVLRGLGPMMLFSRPLAAALRPIVGIEATGSSLRFTTNAVHEVQITQFRQGLHQPPPPNTRQSLRFTSSDTVAYAVRSLALTDIYDQLTQLVAVSRYAGSSFGVVAFENALRQQEIDLREDVLAKLGPEVAVLAHWRETAELPDTALVVQIADVNETRRSLDRTLNILKAQTLGNELQAPWEEFAHRGYRLCVTRLGAGKIAPTYFFTDTFFVLASDPDFARELIDHLARSRPTLAANAAYQTAVAQLPPGNGAFTYCDTATLYQRARPLADQIARQVAAGVMEPGAKQTLPSLLQTLCAPPWAGWIMQLHRLPLPETVTPHLGTFAATTQDELRSKTTFSISPFGTPTGLIAMGIGGLAAPEFMATFRRPATTPTAPKTSTDKAVPPVPPGNQTEASQTPPTR